MTEYIHLIGADDVRSAGHTISSAAQDMKRAAGEIGYALERHERFLQNWLQDFAAIVEELKKPEPAELVTLKEPTV
jgi:hypothetical protein